MYLLTEVHHSRRYSPRNTVPFPLINKVLEIMLKSILCSLKVKKKMQYLEVVHSEVLSSTLAHPALLNNLL